MPGARQTHFDAIVIGSGIGGLTVAAILSKLNHKRVLVLERHYEIGGLTHVFGRGRYRWEVGVHYVGRMFHGAIQRAIMDYITDGHLDWREIPSPFDVFHYPEFSFGVSNSRKQTIRDLIARYPACAREIKRYYRDVNRATLWFGAQFVEKFLPRPVMPIVNLLLSSRRGRQLAEQTVQDYMRRHVSDPELAAVLSTHWGDYGVPPDECSFALHAVVTKHYETGAWFPEGGASRIAATVEEVIERNGGMILVNREVDEILLEDGVTQGVRVLDNRLHEPRVETFHAPTVISSIGAINTFGNLVREPIGESTVAPYRQLQHGHSGVCLFVGLEKDPGELGVHGENLWLCDTLDATDIAGATRDLIAGHPQRCYLSFPSARETHAYTHTAAVIAICNYEPFRQWQDRGSDYYEVKERIARGLLDLVERKLPGFRNLVGYYELSTPLTMERFTGRPNGMMYGMRGTPQFMSKPWFGIDTPVPGLYLTGSEVCAMGVVGGMMGGVGTASLLNGALGFPRITVAARRAARRFRAKKARPPESLIDPIYAVNSDKFRARLVSTEALTDTIVELVYEAPKPISYCAGQYARIQYAFGRYNSYSIVDAVDNRLTFIIDTRFNGPSAQYFKGLTVGDYSTIRLPMGEFALRENDNRKVFVSTGTGFAPLLSMINQLSRGSWDGEIDVYYGCPYARDVFIHPYLDRTSSSLSISRSVCVSREKAAGTIHGHVTEPLKELNGDFDGQDFYVSGNPAMVQSVTDVLREKGVENLYTENY